MKNAKEMRKLTTQQYDIDKTIEEYEKVIEDEAKKGRCAVVVKLPAPIRSEIEEILHNAGYRTEYPYGYSGDKYEFIIRW